MPTALFEPTESPPATQTERSRPRFEFKLSARDGAVVNGGLQAIAHQKHCDALQSTALAGSVDGFPVAIDVCYQRLLQVRIEFEETATPEAKAALRRMQARREEQNRRASGPHDGSLASALCVRRPTTNRQLRRTTSARNGRTSFRGTTRSFSTTPKRRAAGTRRTASATASPSGSPDDGPIARELDRSADWRGSSMLAIGAGTFAAQRELDAHARVLEGVAS